MTCKKCGAEFQCGVQAKEKECWCFSMPPLKPIPKEYADCLCPVCLASFIDPDKNASQVNNKKPAVNR